MSFATPDPVFQLKRISSMFEHVFVIVCFEESSVTLTELTDHVWTCLTDIGEYTDLHILASDDEIMRISSVVKSRKGGNRKTPNGHGMICRKSVDEIRREIQSTIYARPWGDIDRDFILFSEHANAHNVIGVFVRDENSPYLIKR